MSCYRPIRAWKSKLLHPSGKNKIQFKPGGGLEELKLPCGRCIGCKLLYSSRWATRMLHEAKNHDSNYMITLTYDEDHLPPRGRLREADVQKFLKRTRKKIGKFRYAYCGEYGDRFSRPHYHLCVFGLDFNDRELERNDGGNRHYTSVSLSKLWGMGRAELTDLNFDTCAYVARYVTKKITGPMAKYHYEDLPPEYFRMSRRPGIGRQFYETFKGDIFPNDHVVINGKESRPPRYYDKLLEKENPTLMSKLRERRIKLAKADAANQTPERLTTREKCKTLQMKQKVKRKYESTG